MDMRNKRLVIILAATAALLLLPLVAMQFSDDVKWTPFDFVVAGALLLGAGLTYEAVARKGGTRGHRLTVGVVIVAVLVMVWLELAVGVFGTPWGGS
jgi:hypothetical protein